MVGLGRRFWKLVRWRETRGLIPGRATSLQFALGPIDVQPWVNTKGVLFSRCRPTNQYMGHHIGRKQRLPSSATRRWL